MKSFISACLLFFASIGLWAQTPIFSLDDDPSAPVSGPFLGGGFSAEDPLGCTGIALGPSRSLAIFGWQDSDVLAPGPAFLFGIPGASYVDSMSSNHAFMNNPFVNVMFSVDRLGQGNCGAALAIQAATFDQPADIFAGTITYPNPAFFIGSLPAGGCLVAPLGTAGTGGCPNFQVVDEAALGLIANPFPPAPFTHDNIDGVDFPFATNPINQDLYYTIHPSESAAMGIPTGNIWFGPPGAALGNVWAKDYMIGLNCTSLGPDNIDGLVAIDRNQLFPQVAEPGIDGALFSLSPCSGTIQLLQLMGFPADGGTVFFTDFQGSFSVYLWSKDLGISPNGPNIDALDYR